MACAAVFTLGCSKSETPASSQPQNAAEHAGGELKAASEKVAAEAQKQAGELKAAADKTINDASKQTEAAVAKGEGMAQTLIDQAKALINDKKYSEALTALQNLGQMKLTPEQQGMVDNLKALVQKAMVGQGAAGGAKSIGGALGGKD